MEPDRCARCGVGCCRGRRGQCHRVGRRHGPRRRQCGDGIGHHRPARLRPRRHRLPQPGRGRGEQAEDPGRRRPPVHLRQEQGRLHPPGQAAHHRPPPKLDAVHQREVWLAADPSKNGLIHEGGQNITLHNSGTGVVNPNGASQPARPGTVPQIASLSTDPDTLLKQIYTATRGQAPGNDAAAFNWIGETVSESIVPANTASAIWRAAAKIPGIVLVKDTTDAAGRHGEAIAHASNGERTEYIFDHNTHLFLGERSYLVKDTPEGKAGMLTGTSAVLSRAVVNKIGDLPAGTRA
ncbi:CU044_5270 family protein [Streptomyces fagopyri]|uniref:CU044_5270 family protein n=1 Tax=Streptomyces fagopyri TaxID=2662397 RepID=UPI003800887D